MNKKPFLRAFSFVSRYNQSMNSKAIVYFQSGGPTAVINSSLYGVYQEVMAHPDVFSAFYVSHYGVEGLIRDDLYDFGQEDPEEMRYLLQTPGQVIGSSRQKLPDFDDPAFAAIVKTIEKHHIGYILTNGGNDSMNTCARLHAFFVKREMDVKVIGIPKTIDNDLALTDHSVGYPSAARHIMDAAMMALLDVASFRNGKVIFMETMGRNTGWLTASVALLPKSIRPDAFYLPEQKWDTDEFLKNIQAIYAKKRSAVIVLSEGVPLEKRNHEAVDSFGHASLEGVSGTAADLVAAKLGLHSRVISDTSLQRSDAFSITKVDRQEAIAVGQFAVRALCQGVSGKMVALKRVSSKPYHAECVLVDLDEVADAVRALPTSWILSNHEMAPEFIDYLAPLVKETETVQYEDGFLRMPRLKFISVK